MKKQCAEKAGDEERQRLRLSIYETTEAFVNAQTYKCDLWMLRMKISSVLPLKSQAKRNEHVKSLNES